MVHVSSLELTRFSNITSNIFAKVIIWSWLCSGMTWNYLIIALAQLSSGIRKEYMEMKFNRNVNFDRTSDQTEMQMKA